MSVKRKYRKANESPPVYRARPLGRKRGELQDHDPDEERPVKAPADVVRAMAALEKRGGLDLMNRGLVVAALRGMGYASAAEWVMAHRREYFLSRFVGFKSVDGDTP